MTTERYVLSGLRQYLPKEYIERLQKNAVLSGRGLTPDELNMVVDAAIYKELNLDQQYENLLMYAWMRAPLAQNDKDKSQYVKNLLGSTPLDTPRAKEYAPSVVDYARSGEGGRIGERVPSVLMYDKENFRGLYRQAVSDEFDAKWLADTGRGYDRSDDKQRELKALVMVAATATLYGDSDLYAKARAALKESGIPYLDDARGVFTNLPSDFLEQWEKELPLEEGVLNGADPLVLTDFLADFAQSFYNHEGRAINYNNPHDVFLEKAFIEAVDLAGRLKTSPQYDKKFNDLIMSWYGHDWMSDEMARVIPGLPQYVDAVHAKRDVSLFTPSDPAKRTPDGVATSGALERTIKEAFPDLDDEQVKKLAQQAYALLQGSIIDPLMQIDNRAKMAASYTRDGVLVPADVAKEQFYSWATDKKVLFVNGPEAYEKLLDGFTDLYGTYLAVNKGKPVNQQQQFGAFLESEYGQALVAGRLGKTRTGADIRDEAAARATSGLFEELTKSGVSAAEAASLVRAFTDTDAKTLPQFLRRYDLELPEGARKALGAAFDRRNKSIELQDRQAKASDVLVKKLTATGLDITEAVAAAAALSKTNAKTPEEFLEAFGAIGWSDAAKKLITDAYGEVRKLQQEEAAPLRAASAILDALMGTGMDLKNAQALAEALNITDAKTASEFLKRYGTVPPDVQALVEGEFTKRDTAVQLDKDAAKLALSPVAWTFFTRGLNVQEAQFAENSLKMRANETLNEYNRRVLDLANWVSKVGKGRTGQEFDPAAFVETLSRTNTLDPDYYAISGAAGTNPKLYDVPVKPYLTSTGQARPNYLSEWLYTPVGGKLDQLSPQDERALIDAAKEFTKDLPPEQQLMMLDEILSNAPVLLGEYEKYRKESAEAAEGPGAVDPSVILEYIAKQTTPSIRKEVEAKIAGGDTALATAFGTTPAQQEEYLKRAAANEFIAKGGGTVLNQARGTPKFSDFIKGYNFGPFAKKFTPKVPSSQMEPTGSGRSFFV